MIKPLLGLLSPAGPRARLSILIFHRVLPQPDLLFPSEVTAARFDAICGWLKAWFNVLPLDEATHKLQRGELPERALSITFDDGYADNHDIALPILLKHKLTATFFIATGFLDGGRMWNDTVIEAVRCSAVPALDLHDFHKADLDSLPVATLADKQAAINHILGRIKYAEVAQRQAWTDAIAERAQAALPDNLMMTSQQVHQMHRAGMQIGAHTVSHPILARLDGNAARREIETGKHQLEALIDAPVDLFAYPNGKPIEDYSPAHVEMARNAGFRAAVSTAWGAAGQHSDIFQLARFTPWDTTRARFGVRLAGNLWSARRSRAAMPAGVGVTAG